MTAASSDSVIRAITDDSAFRVMVARSTDTVRGIVERQGAKGPAAKLLGDLITATILFRETMAPDLRVQGLLRGAHGSGSLVADSMKDGLTRGLLQLAEGKDTIELGDGALLQMMRTMPNGSVNRGVVHVPEGGGITEAMMEYMQTSEQVDTMLAVATVLDDEGNVAEAGGYIVQLLPEVGRGPLAVMTLRLEDFRVIDGLLTKDFQPEYLRDELLYGMAFTALAKTSLSFTCWCSEERLVAALATLDRGEIRSMIEDGAPLEIACDYCKKQYSIPVSSLRGLLHQS